MKKIILILAVILHFTFNIEHCEAQWFVQNSGTNVNFYDVKFINRYTGYAVGENGTIVKTTNAGENWTILPNPTYGMGKILWCIHPLDSNNIYFVGAHSTYIKTTNGGNTWIEIRNGPWGSQMGFQGVYYLNKDTGWACGDYRVLRTTNGGLTFDSAGIFWGSLADVYFKDFSTGLICGDGVVFKSTDSGLNWFNTNVPVGGYYQFRKLAVVNNQYVWIVGNGPPVYRTTNFGTAWDSVSIIPSYPPSVMIAIAFANINTGFAGGTYGYIYKTTNSGFTWTRQQTSEQRFWGSIYCYSDSIVWGVGGAGKIMHTTTGGQNMTPVIESNGYEPYEFNLKQNYPNPFNNQTTIEFNIKENGIYKLEIFDLSGRKIEGLFNNYLTRGNYKLTFSAENFSSGIYYYKLSSIKEMIIKKLTLIK